MRNVVSWVTIWALATLAGMAQSIGYSLEPEPNGAMLIERQIDLDLGVGMPKDSLEESMLFFKETVNLESQTVMSQSVYRFDDLEDGFKHFCVDFRDEQTVTLHEFYLYRDGKKIDLTENLQSSFSDETETLGRNDVGLFRRVCWRTPPKEVSDLLAVSYSVYQPELRSDTTWLFGFYPGKVSELEMILPPQDPVQYHALWKAPLPVVKRNHMGQKILRIKGEIEYETDYYDEWIPGAGSRKDKIQITNAQSWSQINAELRALLLLDQPLSDSSEELMSQITRRSDDQLAKIKSCIAFLREEMVWYDLKSPIPFSPQETLNKKAGSQFEMAALLNAMLKSIGIEAWCTMVRKEGFPRDAISFPSARAFDHIIVEFHLQDKTYQVDMDEKGRKGPQLHHPSYWKGLRLRPGENGLSDISRKGKSEVRVSDKIEHVDRSMLPTVNRQIDFAGWAADKNEQILTSWGEEKYIRRRTNWIDPNWKYTSGYYHENTTATRDRTWTSIKANRCLWHYGDAETEGNYKNCSFEREGTLHLPNPMKRFLKVNSQSGKGYLHLPYPMHLSHRLSLPQTQLLEPVTDTIEIEGPNLIYRNWVVPHEDSLVFYQEAITFEDHVHPDQRKAYQEFEEEVDESISFKIFYDGPSDNIKVLGGEVSKQALIGWGVILGFLAFLFGLVWCISWLIKRSRRKSNFT